MTKRFVLSLLFATTLAVFSGCNGGDDARQQFMLMFADNATGSRAITRWTRDIESAQPTWQSGGSIAGIAGGVAVAADDAGIGRLAAWRATDASIRLNYGLGVSNWESQHGPRPSLGDQPYVFATSAPRVAFFPVQRPDGTPNRDLWLVSFVSSSNAISVRVYDAVEGAFLFGDLAASLSAAQDVRGEVAIAYQPDTDRVMLAWRRDAGGRPIATATATIGSFPLTTAPLWTINQNAGFGSAISNVTLCANRSAFFIGHVVSETHATGDSEPLVSQHFRIVQSADGAGWNEIARSTNLPLSGTWEFGLGVLESGELMAVGVNDSHTTHWAGYYRSSAGGLRSYADGAASVFGSTPKRGRPIGVLGTERR
ncbi:MAG: hypothetical protein IBJ10_08230 [Phycisphaerales bacterium]|nr:hypothetical protein [Phycisphaerales bacterium]